MEIVKSRDFPDFQCPHCGKSLAVDDVDADDYIRGGCSQKCPSCDGVFYVVIHTDFRVVKSE